MEQRFSKDEQAWYNFLVKPDPKFTDSQRQQLAEMLTLVDTGRPAAIVGGVNERGGFFVWRIQGRNSEEGPLRKTRDEAEADGQLCNAAWRGIGDADDLTWIRNTNSDKPGRRSRSSSKMKSTELHPRCIRRISKPPPRFRLSDT